MIVLFDKYDADKVASRVPPANGDPAMAGVKPQRDVKKFAMDMFKT